jgi:hypothetical protein
VCVQFASKEGRGGPGGQCGAVSVQGRGGIRTAASALPCWGRNRRMSFGLPLIGHVASLLVWASKYDLAQLNTLNIGKFCQVTVSERAGTVDIVRYLLSYIYGSSDICSEDKELTDLAVRNIMVELVSFSALSQSSTSVELTPNQICSSQHEQFSRPPGQNIEMKRGDWICTRYATSNILLFL